MSTLSIILIVFLSLIAYSVLAGLTVRVMETIEDEPMCNEDKFFLSIIWPLIIIRGIIYGSFKLGYAATVIFKRFV
jgi:hypothetical protein